MTTTQEQIADVLAQIFSIDARTDGNADRVAKTLERIAARVVAGELDAAEAGVLVEVQRDAVVEAAWRATGETSITRQNQINAALDALKSLVVKAAGAVM